MALEPTEGELQLLARLDDFVAENSIDLLSFWKTNRLCLTLDEFLDLLNEVNFSVTSQELNLLSKDNVEFINL